MRTAESYRAALRDGRQVFLDGEVVPDVTTHPALRPVVDTFADLFDLQRDPDFEDALMFEDADGIRYSGAWAEPRSKEELAWRRGVTETIARQTGGLFGRQPDYVSLFLLGMHNLREPFSQGRPDFKENIERLWKRSKESDLIFSHAFTAQQTHPSEPLEPTSVPRVVKETDDGVIVRGTYTVGTFVPYSDECLFGTFWRPNLTDAFVIYYALPIDTEGLRVVARDVYGLGGAYESPAGRWGDENDSIIILDDVLVPWERVLSMGNPDFPRETFPRMIHWGHWSILARLAVKVEVVLGLVKLLPEMIGRSDAPLALEAQGELIRYLTTIRSFIYAAEDRGHETESGYWMADPSIILAGRAYSIEHYRRIIGYLHELGSQSLINPPSQGNLESDVVGPALTDLLAGENWTAQERVRAFRYAFDLACSSFGGRQTLFEMFNAQPWWAQRAMLVRDFDFAPYTRLARAAVGTLSDKEARQATLDAAAAQARRTTAPVHERA